MDEEYEHDEDVDIDISSDPPTGHVVPIMTGHLSFAEEEDGEFVDEDYLVQHPHDVPPPESEGRYSSFTSSSDSDVDDVTYTDRPYLAQQQLEQMRARTRNADESSDSVDGEEPHAYVEEIADDVTGFEDDIPDDEDEEEDDDDTERPHLYVPKAEQSALSAMDEPPQPDVPTSLAPPPLSQPTSSPMSNSPSVGTLRSVLKINRSARAPSHQLPRARAVTGGSTVAASAFPTAASMGP
ncbi:hypothetical protein BD626DRAFT_91080 [Schizophyllum amplum]|uniref:Uncharacterized protein n=1 Tax=Schizophyllum amplum TaxID=97359 RepID=A0A550C8M6_9AGAR|nr:hypothetical protein BD626DRAFT_91080 [Auriculariopsis ampla]